MHESRLPETRQKGQIFNSRSKRKVARKQSRKGSGDGEEKTCNVTSPDRWTDSPAKVLATTPLRLCVNLSLLAVIRTYDFGLPSSFGFRLSGFPQPPRSWAQSSRASRPAAPICHRA